MDTILERVGGKKTSRPCDRVNRVNGIDEVTFTNTCITEDHITSVSDATVLHFINCFFDSNVTLIDIDMISFNSCQNFPKFSYCGTAKIVIVDPEEIVVDTDGLETVSFVNSNAFNPVDIVFRGVEYEIPARGSLQL